MMTPSLRDQLLKAAQSQAPGFVDLEPIVQVVAKEALRIAKDELQRVGYRPPIRPTPTPERFAYLDGIDQGMRVLQSLLTEIEIISPQRQEQKSSPSEPWYYNHPWE